jgi:IS5 family transposase
MRKRIWQKYNQNLVNRGRITFYIDEESLASNPRPKHVRGRPRLFSHPLIQLLLILKIQYKMPYRALEGFAKDILPLFISNNIKLPSYSIICRRASELGTLLPKLSKRKPQIIMLDATGVKVFGEGEWKVKIHGKTKRRKWIKIHIAVDAKTQEIIHLEMTEGTVADCEIGPKLIANCPSSAKVYLGDGGYDTRGCRKAIKDKGAKALIPPRKNARWDPKLKERNRGISERRGLGLDNVGISLWGKLTGYSKRALVETSFSRLKRIYGGGLCSRKMSSQRVEGHLKCLMLNKMLQKIG